MPTMWRRSNRWSTKTRPKCVGAAAATAIAASISRRRLGYRGGVGYRGYGYRGLGYGAVAGGAIARRGYYGGYYGGDGDDGDYGAIPLQLRRRPVWLWGGYGYRAAIARPMTITAVKSVAPLLLTAL